MVGPIDVQAFGLVRPGAQHPVVLSVLPGAIPGVEANYYVQAAGTVFGPARQSHRGQMLLFCRGEGELLAGTARLPVAGIAAFCPAGAGPISIRAWSDVLEYLEILMDLHESESVPPRPDAYFMPYAQCAPYAEAIKSAKTVSRTIVPPHILPRFCMGSVETTGPDAVGAHAHPMLEQLFFGLPGNRCVVTADDTEALLTERMLLHVPLGSRHGVRVEAGDHLHYVWMDFFRESAGLSYIDEQHKPLENTAVHPGPTTDEHA